MRIEHVLYDGVLLAGTSVRLNASLAYSEYDDEFRAMLTIYDAKNHVRLDATSYPAGLDEATGRMMTTLDAGIVDGMVEYDGIQCWLQPSRNGKAVVLHFESDVEKRDVELKGLGVYPSNLRSR